MKWKNLFQDHILGRGRDYYSLGNVQNLKITENKISACVNGAENYDVSIILKNGGINKMTCTCPYADSQNNCKHMAAVLYAAQSEKPEKNNFDTEIRALLEQTEVCELKNFFIELLQEDKNLLLRLKSFLAKKPEDVDLKGYKKQIDRAIGRYMSYDYIDYDDAERFIEEMKKYLYNDTEQLIKKNLLSAAFELSSYLFSKTSDVQMDDYDGELLEFRQLCCKFWEKIISSADKPLKEKMFYWMMSYIDTSETSDIIDDIENTVMGQFTEPEYLQEKLIYTEKRASQSSSDNWYDWHEREHWIRLHIIVMEQMNASSDEILEYCQKYMKYPLIRKYCVALYLRQKNDKAAIALLEESLILDKEHTRFVSEYRHILKDLYKKSGNQEKYLKYLWQIVVDDADLDEFRELKALYSKDEWQNVREKLFKEMSPCQAATLYEEEKLYERLLQHALSQDSIFEMKRYESSLAKYYPEQVISKYANYLMELAEQTACRKTYKKWASFLQHMTKIQGGKDCVGEILTRWRALYPKRKAMMEELDKVKL